VANISRNTFVESKGYDKVILQQGVPITDYDWNEAQDIQRVKLRRIIKELLGDGAINEGFKVVENTPNNQTVLVKSGTIYIDGYRVKLDTNAEVPMPNAPTSGTRKDFVYAEVSEQEIDSIMDPDIKHPKLDTVEPTRRIKVSVNFKVDTKVPADTEFVKYYALAEVTRNANDNVISNDDIKDLRSVKANFEGEGFNVKGSVTLGDSEDDQIDIQGAIRNTSQTFSGYVYVDDKLKVTGELVGLNKAHFTGLLRTDSDLFVKGAIKNDTSSNGGYVLVNDGLRVTGEHHVQENLVTVTRNVTSSDQTILRMNGTGGKEWQLLRGNANGKLYLRNISDSKTALTLGTNETLFESYNVRIATNLDVDGTLNADGATTLNNGLTVTGSHTSLGIANGDHYTMINRSSVNPTLYVRQNGTGDIAHFGNVSTTDKLVVTNSGGIKAGHDILTDAKLGFTTNTYFILDGSRIRTPNALRVDGNIHAFGDTIFFGTTDDVKLYRRAANVLKTDDNLEVALTLKVTGATTLSNTLSVTGATTLNNKLKVVGAVDLDSTLNVDGASTFNGNVTLSTGADLTVPNGQILLQRNHATAPALFVDQDGEGSIVHFRTKNNSLKVEIKNDGTIDTKGNVYTEGEVVAKGKVVQRAKRYEVARVPLYGIAGDLQYQTNATSFEDIISTYYGLFATGGSNLLPDVDTGASRVYVLAVTYSQDDENAQVTVRLTDGTVTPINFDLPKFAGGLDNGERKYVRSAEFTQAPSNSNFALQAKTTSGNMTIMYVELIAYDVY